MSDLRLSAYYFTFSATGVAEIDRILEAVAMAGKAYHSTEYWADEDHGESFVSLIQRRAIEAAQALAPLPPQETRAPENSDTG